MKKQVLICISYICAAGVLQAIPVADNFDDGVLDTSKWISLDKDGAFVTEANGVVIFGTTDDTRPFLVTQGSWDPAVEGTLTVTGTVYIAADEAMVVWTRSNGEYDSVGWPNNGGVIGSGLRFSFANNEYNVNIMTKEDSVGWNAISSMTKNIENLSVVPGDWYFTVTDNGSQVSIEVVNAADPANYATATANTNFMPAVTSNKVVFGVSAGELDNITIAGEGDGDLTECIEWGYQISDLNKDCKVDLSDLVVFCSQWLNSTLP
ncbi:hypothetical protein STSP2_03237 [Anaerohalosphaera lusitana]|uniref:Uncharacterized protein n=1 Tax=Anaerohalosphaera lusitana TaxID=1936003 RepID=A0A1U9NQD7_9BACT|nr:hypothetical protein [Anaerohalosphaera lusitana]AQT70035.1 hypothetical protein STSP2_03237 [Anaerohalosphaera lusitana]